MRFLELLAPARDINIGIAAIDCGADAVYIGGPAFGARQAAGNSVEDLRKLCDYAHRFGARVFVTINTIIYDSELEEAARLLGEVYEAGADAVIAQDMALLKLNTYGIPLHASTQCAIRTAEKARELESLGFSRLTLERELPLERVREICAAVDCEVECFVHGAMCVCYSGQCYLSEHLSGRSANRGACVQACRSRYDLVDKAGRVLVRDKALLSLKDYNLKSRLGDLAEAGVTSFKIEGRLKNISYARNVVREYSLALDEVVARQGGKYARASFGRVRSGFAPDVAKTFNRGYTAFLMAGKQTSDGSADGKDRNSGRGDMAAPNGNGGKANTDRVAKLSGSVAAMDAAKGMGEEIGRIVNVAKDFRSFKIRGHRDLRLANGDGLAFVSRDGEVVGVRADVCEGTTVKCKRVPELYEGAAIFRNHDIAFEKSMSANPCTRMLSVTLSAIFHSPENESSNDVPALPSNDIFHLPTNDSDQISPAFPDIDLNSATTTNPDKDSPAPISPDIDLNFSTATDPDKDSPNKKENSPTSPDKDDFDKNAGRDFKDENSAAKEEVLTVKARSEDGREVEKTYSGLWADYAENKERMLPMWQTQLSKTAGIFAFQTCELQSDNGKLPLLSASAMNSIRSDIAAALSELPCHIRPSYKNPNADQFADYFDKGKGRQKRPPMSEENSTIHSQETGNKKSGTNTSGNSGMKDREILDYENSMSYNKINERGKKKGTNTLETSGMKGREILDYENSVSYNKINEWGKEKETNTSETSGMKDREILDYENSVSYNKINERGKEKGTNTSETSGMKYLATRGRELTYKDNVANEMAREIYSAAGFTVTEPAYELSHRSSAELMRTKYCIRRELNICPNAKGTHSQTTDHFHTQGDNHRTCADPAKESAAANPPRAQSSGGLPCDSPAKKSAPLLKGAEPLYLINNGRRLCAIFDCRHCEMVIKSDPH